MKRLFLICWATALAGGVDGQEQTRQFIGNQAMTERAFSQHLSEPFVGVTSDGRPIPDLYSITGPEGESNSRLVEAANAYLDSLTREQRQKTQFDVDDDQWRLWSNVRPTVRRGLGLYELTEGQRERVLDLMRVTLSAKGYATSRDIMRLNETLAELSGNTDLLSELFYWVGIMGEPSETNPWGWQIEGHHLSVNYFVLGDRVVMSPVFMGSEPVFAASGVFQGTSVLLAQRERAFALFASLTPEQRQVAVVSADELPEPWGRNFSRTSIEMMSDNAVIPYQGIRADALSEEQRIILLGVIEEVVAHNRAAYAEIRMRQIAAYLDETYFAWNQWDPALGAEDLFFFRIQSPVIVIELDHQGSVDLPGGAAGVPNRQHLHVIARTPNGNDYGKAWLRQHYELYPH